MKLVDEINDLEDIQRAAKCIIDRIERMLAFQENPDPYAPDASLFYEVYPVSDAEKRWWNDLHQTLADQDNCIEDRLSVLKSEDEYVYIKNAIKECDEQIESLITEADRARDTFDRDAFNAAETKLKIVRRVSDAHHADLYKLASPPGGGSIKWQFVRRGEHVPNDADIDALAVSFAEKCSLDSSSEECKSTEVKPDSSRVEIEPASGQMDSDTPSEHEENTA